MQNPVVNKQKGESLVRLNSVQIENILISKLRTPQITLERIVRVWFIWVKKQPAIFYAQQ